jgi:hypothetical protein
MSCFPPRYQSTTHPRIGTEKRAHLLRLSLLVCRKELVCERALHGTAVAEHAVIGETGRQTRQGLLNDRILLSDDVVVPVFPPPAKS